MKIITGIILFLLRQFKVILRLLGTQLGGVAAAIFDTVKSVGISKIIVVWFMLKFIFVGFYNWMTGSINFMAFLNVIVRTIIASEREIITQIDLLKQVVGGVTLHNIGVVFNIYLTMLGAIFVLWYLFKAFNWGLSKIVTNDSFKGIGVWSISLGFIILLEIIGLIFIASASYGSLSDIPMTDLTPFSGLYSVTQNMNVILHPFGGNSTSVMINNVTDTVIENMSDLNMTVSQQDQPGLLNFIRSKLS